VSTLKNSTKNRACGKKRQHEDRADAEEHMDKLVQGGSDPSTLNVYRCRHCGHWHCGHKPGSQRSR
jgi:rubrerythrin